jgi:hypothetical protein
MARVTIHRDQFRALRTSAKAQALVDAAAERIAAACNGQSTWGGYEASSRPNPTQRAAAYVWTIEPEAVADNARNQRLIRNLDAGR